MGNKQSRMSYEDKKFHKNVKKIQIKVKILHGL